MKKLNSWFNQFVLSLKSFSFQLPQALGPEAIGMKMILEREQTD